MGNTTNMSKLTGIILLFQRVTAEEVAAFSKVFYGKVFPWFTLLHDNTVAMWSKLTEQEPEGMYVFDRQGNVIHSVQAQQCNFSGLHYHYLLEVTPPGSDRHLAISCAASREIWLYSVTTQSFRSVYSDLSRRGPIPDYMCHGPNNTILACDHTTGSCQVAEFHFTNDHTLTLSRLIEVQGNPPVAAVCYLETTQGPLLFTSNWEGHTIHATHLQSGHTQWQVQGQVDGKECEPRGLCYGAGRLYVADGYNQRILVLDAATGGFIQSIVLPPTGSVADVAWSEQQPHLVVQQVTKDSDEKYTHNICYLAIE